MTSRPRRMQRFSALRSGGSIRRGAIFAGVILAVAAAPGALAATYYVDGGCGTNGNGQILTCASASGGSGAFNTIQAGVNALSAAGDTLYVRGVHGSFDGRYSSDRIAVSGKSGSPSNPIVIQPYGFPSAPETVYIESSLPATWTPCDSTTCAGAPSISETWFTTKTNDGSNRAYWAQKPDGSITPRKLGLSDLTQQYDGYSCEGCSTLYVRWGTSLPSKPYVNYANNGNGFTLQNVSDIVIRGFTYRAIIRAAVQIDPPNTDITISNSKFFYINDSGNGSARPVTAQSSVNVVIANNEFAYSSSEPLHLSNQVTGSLSGAVRNNWVHDIGDRTVLGPGTGGTPNCTTFTSDAPQAGSTLGDFSGLIVEGNVFERCYDNTAILFESDADGMTVRNNIIRQVPLAFKFSPDNGGASNHTSNNKIYNNLIYSLVSGSHNGSGDCVLLTGSSPIQNNAFWNNTCVGILNLGVESQAGSNTSGNLFLNNIFVKSSGSVVNSVQAATFQNNLVWNGSTSGSVGSVGGSTVTCGSGGNRCGDPLFVNGSGGDFHIQAGSPAIDGGNSTAVPAGRTSDICLAIASTVGPVGYSDCQSLTGPWDIGMDELGGSSSAKPTATLSLSDPSPVAAGSVTITLTASMSLSSVPGPLTFTESDGTTDQVALSGAVPGTAFSGVLTVDTTVADGVGVFSLPTGSLVSTTGTTGETITSVNGVAGAAILIDKTPPTTPTNLRFSP